MLAEVIILFYIYKIHVFISSHCLQNHIGDAMISVLVSGAVETDYLLHQKQKQKQNKKTKRIILGNL
jgi:hypothetical protein